ncbi:cytochrome b562 [Pseudoalteromonas tunicata]|jgi:soluble cytochrome b562|uniref:Soluble cytochrome b562 n=1 Tax=Pseudoalteromonas tunicata D2 TaxID=87626 RepID=A4C4I2_9GAMM|nr:cytochrome b562 [Pseudoalteromonas tunicata]ATC97053.1 soluble cytochrome b562 [Pseudoalteromonas tunicata]AXT33171.1 hypothetical protein D1819_20350 [Pseudoalteromonas tunicata]EAR30464.1 hypothetical protein PTD2_02806 [Pseudoalteromonas tunicata D2]MDP4984255.1 cytochrome b562 [Pseudoalteromonas tunicata]MDP5214941.1 cytochrome b562 [Pseudoalteromonas tunicata]
MKILIAFSFTLFFFSHTVLAQNDLEVTMKNMALSYKNTMQAQNVDSLINHLNEFKSLVLKSKELGFPPEKSVVSIEGIDKVLVLINKAEVLAKNGQLLEAQSILKSVDGLRKEYHKYHEPSLWQLIFG